MKSHDCAKELHQVQLRATPTRLALLQFIESTNKPLDVQSMITYLQSQKILVDPATVFRIVNLFTQKGITKQIQLQEGKFRYELAKTADHHHLVCTVCGDIQDLTDCTIANLEKEIKLERQFIITSHSMELYGICAHCNNIS